MGVSIEEKSREYAKRMAENFYSTAIKLEANVARLKKLIADTGKTEEEVKLEEIEKLTTNFMKTTSAVISAILTGDIISLSPPNGWLRTTNTHSRQVFKEMTGIYLGRTNKSTIEALKKWAQDGGKVTQRLSIRDTPSGSSDQGDAGATVE